MTIKVQGETYDTPEELFDAILELERKLEDMPSDTPEHNALARHIEVLQAALPGEATPDAGGDAEEGAGEADKPDEPETVAPERAPALVAAPEPEPEQTHECPLCGHDLESLPDPPYDPTAEQCPACQGFGVVFTGSRVEGHTWRTCPTCVGNGYIEKASAIPLPPPAVRAVAAPEWPGATWDATTQRWVPPTNELKPWPEANWDGLAGKYV